MKKRSILKALLLVLLSCLLAVALVACGGKHTVTYVYTGVDANADGQDDTVTVEVSDGAKLEKPADPTRDGYTFAGWSDGTGIWDFQTDTVTGDITLTARWSAGGDPSTGELDSSVHVYFDLQGNIENGTPSEGEVPTSQTVATGSEITLPAAPAAASGYTFAGWLVDGETELRAAGSKYTVSATVTIRAQWTTLTKVTAKWNTEGVFTFDGEAITLTVNKDLVGTYQPTEEQGGDIVTFTVKKEELQAAADALTAALAAGEFPTTAVPGAFHVTQKEPTCTEDGKAAVVYTANAVSGSFYAQDAIEAYAQDLPAHGHDYQWEVTKLPSVNAAQGSETAGTARNECSNCGKEETIELPAITVDLTTGEITEGYTVDMANTQLPTCTEDGVGYATYKVPGNKGTVTASAPLAALGHDFLSAATFAEGKVTTTCQRNECNAMISATVTFAKGDDSVTGTLPTTITVTYANNVFTVTLPSGSSLTRDGYTFNGWSDGVTTRQEGATATVAVDGVLTLTAQWIDAQHVHSFTQNKVAYADNTVYLICDDGDSTAADTQTKATVTFDKDITIAEGGVIFAEGAFTIDTTKVSVTGKATEDIVVGYVVDGKLYNVDAEFNVSPGGTLSISVVVEDTNFTIGALDEADWDTPQWSTVLRKGESVTYIGTMNSAMQGTLPEGGTDYHKTVHALIWSQLNDNNAGGILRLDNFVGLSEGTGNEVTVKGMNWTVTKYCVANWELLVRVVKEGNVVVRYDWTDTDCIEVIMIASKGSEAFTCRYEIRATEDALPDWYYIGLCNENATETMSRHAECQYTNGVCDTCRLACKHEFSNETCVVCGATVTTTPVNKTVSNPTVWTTWEEIPAEVSYGTVLRIEGSQAGANPTEKDGEGNWIAWHTVLWQIDALSFTGRLDNYGWTFPDVSALANTNLVDLNTLKLVNANNEEQSHDWEKVHYLMQNSDFVFTFDWTSCESVKITIEITATSGTYNGWTYTNEYVLGIVQTFTGSFKVKLTAENVVSFTVDSYTSYSFAE